MWRRVLCVPVICILWLIISPPWLLVLCSLGWIWYELKHHREMRSKRRMKKHAQKEPVKAA